MRVFKSERQRPNRHGVSELIATLLLIAMVVAAALVLYAFASGVFTNLVKGEGGPSYLVTASGGMTVPGSTDPTGVLTLNLRNQGTVSISKIAVGCANPPFSSINCNGIALDYSGMLVAPGNLLPPNALATGSANVVAASTFTAGSSYLVSLTVTFVGGSTQILVVSVNSAA